MSRSRDLKELWLQLADECFATLVFAELQKGNQFILFPEPGNHGEGFKAPKHTYTKIDDKEALNIYQGREKIPGSAKVIRIINT